MPIYIYISFLLLHEGFSISSVKNTIDWLIDELADGGG